MSRRILSLSLSINGVSYLITEGISDGSTWSSNFISFSVGILSKDTSRHCRCLLNPLWLLFHTMKRNRRLTVSVITSVLMLLPVFTSTPLQPPTTSTFTRKVCHTGAQKVYYRSNSQTFTDKLIIEWIWNVRAVSLAKGFTVMSTVKPTRYTSVSNLFHFGMTLYMFRTVFPSIISSSRLYIQQQAFVKQNLLSAL